MSLYLPICLPWVGMVGILPPYMPPWCIWGIYHPVYMPPSCLFVGVYPCTYPAVSHCGSVWTSMYTVRVAGCAGLIRFSTGVGLPGRTSQKGVIPGFLGENERFIPVLTLFLPVLASFDHIDPSRSWAAFSHLEEGNPE